MYLIAIAWIYVVLMMAVAEAISSQGSVLGAFFTFIFYGVMPLSILMYIMATPGRKRARRAAELAESAGSTPSAQKDGRRHAASDTVPAERKEP